MYSKKVTAEGKRLKDLIVASLFLFTVYQIRASESRTVGCGGKPADVVFLLDASNSIWRPHFRRQLQFVKDMIDWFPVGRDAMRVALVTYADYPQLQFRLHDYFTKPQLHAAVDAVRQNGGYHTRTGSALAFARQNVLLRAAAGGGGGGEEVRTNVTKVVVVITDGLSDNRAATAREARRTRDAGIHVFGVGVGKEVDLEELDAIASSPSKYYTFLVGGYEGLDNIRELLAIKTCEVTDPTTSTTTTTTPTTTTKTTTTTTMTTMVAASTTATTTTSSAPTTATTAATTTVPPSHSTSDSYSNTTQLRNNQTRVKDGDNDGDGDGDGSDSATNETVRTPVILPYPTFIPNPTDTSPVAELKVPEGESNPVNCSDYFVSPDRDNETGKDNEVENTQVTKTPCSPNGGELGKNPENGGTIDGEKGPNAGGSGYWEYNEHGRWIGTRFVKMKNGEPERNQGTDTEALVGRKELIQPITAPTDHDSTVTEGDDRRTDKIKGNPDRNDPRYHVYIGSGPWGTSGYWYLDEVLGYVWYRYDGHGNFVLDLDTTNRVLEIEEEKRRKEMSETSTVNSHGEQGTTLGLGLRDSSTSNSGSEDKTSPTRKFSDGYWGLDESGLLVWYRRTKAGYFEKLYPQDVDQSGTDATADGIAKTTPIVESDEKTNQPGSMLAGDPRLTSTTASDPPMTSENLEREDDGSEDVGESDKEDAEYDFWRFVRDRRVWFQYVPPNDLDENDEENRIRTNPTQAVEIPMDMATLEDEGRWKVVAEKRRVWKNSRTPGGDAPVVSEELLGESSDRNEKDSSTVRLDDERGQRLWNQLVNLTDVKLPADEDPLRNFKTRFQVLREELSDAAKTEKRNRSDLFHESYWFYDDTGRRFQVIHRYNVTSGEEFERDGGGGDVGTRFLPPQINPVVKWEREETQVRGSQDDRALRDSDGAQVRENYGGEYWIRALGPSGDESGNRKPVDTEALGSRTGLSIDLPDRKAIQPKTKSSALGSSSSNHWKRKDFNGKEEDGRTNSLPTETENNNALSKANKKKSSKAGRRNGKRNGRKSGEKHCRSKRPIFIVFALLNAVNNERLDAMLNVAQTTVARLTEDKDSSTGMQVRYYPDVVYSSSNSSSSGRPGRAPMAATPSKTFTDVARIFSKDAGERKRAGKPRTRRILVFLIDGGRLPDEDWQTTSGSSTKRLPKDVEHLVVGVGREPEVERLERFAKSLRSKRTSVVHDGLLSPNNSASNSRADISEKLVSTICWPLAKRH